MLRRLLHQLWLCTPVGRAQADHRRVLARLHAYCGKGTKA